MSAKLLSSITIIIAFIACSEQSVSVRSVHMKTDMIPHIDHVSSLTPDQVNHLNTNHNHLDQMLDIHDMLSVIQDYSLSNQDALTLMTDALVAPIDTHVLDMGIDLDMVSDMNQAPEVDMHSFISAPNIIIGNDSVISQDRIDIYSNEIDYMVPINFTHSNSNQIDARINVHPSNIVDALWVDSNDGQYAIQVNPLNLGITTLTVFIRSNMTSLSVSFNIRVLPENDCSNDEMCDEVDHNCDHLVSDVDLQGLSTSEEMKSRSISLKSDTGDPLILMDMGKSVNSNTRNFRMFSKNDSTLTVDLVIAEGGNASQAVPLLLYHESGSIYGLIYTIVNARLSNRPTRSKIMRFHWTPMEEEPFTMISTTLWVNSGPDSKIIHATDTANELLLLVSQSHTSLPLSLVKLQKEALSVSPNVIEFNDDYTGITINDTEVNMSSIISLAISNYPDIIWRYEGLTVFGAKISSPLTFIDEIDTRIIVVSMGRNAPQVPRDNYLKVWTYIVPTNATEVIYPTSINGYDMFTNPTGTGSWLPNELSVAETTFDETPALAIIVSLNSRDGDACMSNEGDSQSSSCATGQRCRLVELPDVYQCKINQGTYLGRAVLQFNRNGTLKENPWQSKQTQLLSRRWQMYYDRGQTAVSWIEEDGVHPTRLNIGKFSFSELLCQDGSGPCSVDDRETLDLDTDGIDSIFDCDDNNSNEGQFDETGAVCTPYNSIYGSYASFTREVSWLGDALLLTHTEPVILTQERIDSSAIVRMTYLNICE